ncbi:hypothetical protein [Actinoplanes sp. NPDC026619]|uniref:hypothetical protein n=1 Tax=Actinoplanes sp. NPDC026619 TaxID=3155798 RepID=UPI0033C4E440
MPVEVASRVREVNRSPKLEVDRLYAMCEQICRLPAGDVGEVATALGLLAPTSTPSTTLTAS